ncbi:hypothetical protein [Streptomyces sp. NPDC001340]
MPVTGGGLVTIALGLRGHEDTSTDTVAEELKLAAELGLRFVHGNGIDDDELRMLADAGSSVSISPDVELKMGFGWPLTGRVMAAGLRPTLSVDDVPAAGGDMSPPCAPPTRCSAAWTAACAPGTCWSSPPSTAPRRAGSAPGQAASGPARTPM